MSERIDQLETAFAETMANFSKEVGIVGSAEGRFLGRLILAGRPLTQDELMECTGASRGKVSTALRNLCEAGFVRKIRLAGSRREHYEARQDLWRATIGFVLGRISRQISGAHTEFSRILRQAKELKKQTGSQAEKRAASRLVSYVSKLRTYAAGAGKLIDAVQTIVDRSKV